MNSIYNIGASRLMIALLATGMSLASCSSDDALSNNEETKAVKVAISTRSGETGTEENPWLVDDVITLQAYASGAATQTATYTFDGTSKWSTATGLYWDSYQTKLDFLGYYPTTATAKGLAFALLTDQSDATKLHAADYMTTDRKYGESNIDADGTKVDFAFSHRLVKIVMNVTYDAEFEATKPTLSLERILSQGSGVSVTVNADNSTKSTVTTTGDAVLVQPLIGKDGNEVVASYTAIVTPGTLTSGSTVLMTLAVEGEMRQATYTGSLTALESGKAYSFNVKIGREQIEIADNGVTVVDWDNGAGNEIPGGQVTQVLTLTTAGTLTDDMLTQAIGNGNTFLIEGSMNDNDFTTLRDWAIANKDEHPLKTLDLSGVTGLTALPDNAFCKVEGAEESSVTTLASIKLPASVTTIGSHAFRGCTALKDIDLSRITAIGEYGFSGCTSLGVIDAPQLVLLKSHVFYGCGTVSRINLPASTGVENVDTDIAALGGITMQNGGTINLPLCTKVGKFMFEGLKVTTATLRMTAAGTIEMNNEAFGKITLYWTKFVLVLNKDKKAGGKGSPTVYDGDSWGYIAKGFILPWSSITYVDNDGNVVQ